MLRDALIATLAIAAVDPVHADNRPVIYPDGTVVYGEWGLGAGNNAVPYAEYWGPQF